MPIPGVSNHTQIKWPCQACHDTVTVPSEGVAEIPSIFGDGRSTPVKDPANELSSLSTSSVPEPTHASSPSCGAATSNGTDTTDVDNPCTALADFLSDATFHTEPSLAYANDASSDSSQGHKQQTDIPESIFGGGIGTSTQDSMSGIESNPTAATSFSSPSLPEKLFESVIGSSTVGQLPPADDGNNGDVSVSTPVAEAMGLDDRPTYDPADLSSAWPLYDGWDDFEIGGSAHSSRDESRADVIEDGDHHLDFMNHDDNGAEWTEDFCDLLEEGPDGFGTDARTDGVFHVPRLRLRTTDGHYRMVESLPPSMRHPIPYNLRPGAREHQIYDPGAWVDHDESGDYDPKLGDVVTPIISPKSKRKASCLTTMVDTGPSEIDRASKRPNPGKRARQIGSHILFSFPIKSERARKLVSTCEDNWPFDDSSSAPDKEDTDVDSRAQSASPYKLRRRKDQSDSDDVNSKEHWNDLTVGHPLARSCRCCLDAGQECPLLSPGSSYPCYFCVEDDCECELVVEPIKKRSCEKCRASRFDCSYRLGGDHEKPCDRCDVLGFRCVAGPAIDSTRVRLMPDGSPAKLEPKEDRPYVACTNCRKNKKTCSLLKDSGEPPCALCLACKIPCTFASLTKPERKKGAKSKSESDVSGKGTNRFLEIGPGIKSEITSSLSHPINFYSSEESCSWCNHGFLGLYGCGPPVKVTVWKHAEGTHYTELSGGYHETWLDTNMCADCTDARMAIMKCPGHQPKGLQSVNCADPPTVNDLVGQLQSVQGSIPKTKEALLDWCSICPAPAFVRCCTSQMDGTYGCGARFCSHCWRAVSAAGSSLETIMAWIESQKSKARSRYPCGSRADCELLLPGGLLWSSVVQGRVAGKELLGDRLHTDGSDGLPAV